MTSSISAAQARRIALSAQGFGARPTAAGTRQINAVMSRLSVLQIDSVNVFARSHYLPLFSRLGNYDTALLDRLVFARRPAYVEYWAHVASFIPIADWNLFRFRMDQMYQKYGSPRDGWYQNHRRLVDWVRAELAERGPLRPAQIEHDTPRGKRGPWWDWDEVKQALEHLWYFGEVAIAGRRGFQRRYALAQDVVPAAVLNRPVPKADAYRELILRATRAYGVGTTRDLADYWRLTDRAAVQLAIRELVDLGELVPVTVAGWASGGKSPAAWIHRDVVIPRKIDAIALLSPFDPVVWFRERAQRLFGFEYRIEIYTPAARRRYGYYSLPVLGGDTIIGRIDLKADRANSTLLVQSAWWERDASAQDAVTSAQVERVAEQVRLAARWQRLDRLSVSSWGNATADLARALPEALRHA